MDDLVKLTKSGTFGTLTPPRSIPSPLPFSKTSNTKKRKSLDASQEYEIEKIVGYHRDKKHRMWYLVKWKGWGDEYNTYEPMENMTRCNFLLMKFFEYETPSATQLKNKEEVIENSLNKHSMYLRLKRNNYCREDLMEFSKNYLDISKLFGSESTLKSFENTIKEEYQYIIRCLIGMQYHQDRKLFERGQNYRICLELINLRQKQIQTLKSSEKLINQLESCPISIENKYDFECLPTDLEYVVDLKLGDNITVPKDPLLGCECIGGCDIKTQCCGKMANSVFAYNSTTGKLRIREQTPIYECNWRCKCPKTCPNRVVQQGRKIRLCICKTKLCGWGVKTLEKIPKGTFVCEYIAELIQDADAVVRDLEYFKQKKSYIFDLDFNPDQECNQYCLDATNYGNVGRFINHSCDPNLSVYPVWIDCLDPNLPRLAFFARRNIKRFEELNFDYENFQDNQGVYNQSEDDRKSSGLRMISRVRCQCNAKNCREWVFGST